MKRSGKAEKGEFCEDPFYKKTLLSGTVLLIVILLLPGIIRSAHAADENSADWRTLTVSGHITDNTIWTIQRSPVIVNGTITVDEGVSLGVESGVEVKFIAYVNLIVLGELCADGAIFTSGKASPAPCDWQGIYFAEGSTGGLENCEVSYAWTGISVSNCTPSITDCTIAHNREGIRYSLSGTVGPINLIGHTFRDNLEEAAILDLTHHAGDINVSGNSASGNGYNGVLAESSSLGGLCTWSGQQDFPFIIHAGLDVEAGAQLTINPRSVIKSTGNPLEVSGKLYAYDAYFTSIKNDAVGGDTNGDGSATSPAPNDWTGIRLYDAVSNGGALENCEVSYAYIGIDIRNCAPAINDCAISHHSIYGIQADQAAAPTITSCKFAGEDNAASIMFGDTAGGGTVNRCDFEDSSFGSAIRTGNSITVCVDAKNNWWGDASGPYNWSDNTDLCGLTGNQGSGRTVSNNVDYVPWLGTPVPIPVYASVEHTDYTGSGKSDPAIFMGQLGLWAFMAGGGTDGGSQLTPDPWSSRTSSRIYFGGPGDNPAPGDYNGDGTTDITVYRASSGLWAVRSVTRVYFGGSDDRPQPGDYDGNGTWEVGLFRPSSGLWAIRGITRIYFGNSTDTPVSGYYAGEGARNIALFQSSSGLWAVRNVTRVYFGAGTDKPVPGDYDGDGTWVPGIFRPASGVWAVRGETRTYFGGSSDAPVPADYNGDGTDDIGTFRDSTGLWAAKGITRFYFGRAGMV
ncbi:MAG: right-handed parallel beta-helix repeat-containing protein, partial [Candidatus Aureabacteria bacterium]|nr:right-handed parallel beta-helix repeat-containing protein [Candidatus Auribacterota bacterium]